MKEAAPAVQEPTQPDATTTYDHLLTKYIAVWLWSILFGTTTGILYSSFSIPFRRWGGLGPLLAIPTALAVIFGLLSCIQLYKGLRDYLLPNFFFESNSDRNLTNPTKFAYHLRRAFFYFLFAITTRAVSAVLDALLNADSF